MALLGSEVFAEPVIVLNGEVPRGSAVSIKTENNYSLLLSARHVCVGNTDPYIETYTGEVYQAVVYRIHTAADVCLMVAFGSVPADPIAEEVTYIPGSIVLIETAFPNQVTGKRFPVLVLNNYYWAEEEVDFRIFVGYSRGGMSGSPVYNGDGEVIGILIVSAGEALGGFTELKYIRELLLDQNCIGLKGVFSEL